MSFLPFDRFVCVLARSPSHPRFNLSQLPLAPFLLSFHPPHLCGHTAGEQTTHPPPANCMISFRELILDGTPNRNDANPYVAGSRKRSISNLSESTRLVSTCTTIATHRLVVTDVLTKPPKGKPGRISLSLKKTMTMAAQHQLVRFRTTPLFASFNVPRGHTAAC